MYAITIAEAGGPDVLTWSEGPEPELGPHDVLIDVAASAVNRADLMQRAGRYPPPPGAPPYPGLECSGRIVALGAALAPDASALRPNTAPPATALQPDPAGAGPARSGAATSWRVGDEVCALLAGGGYAQRVAVPASHVLSVPRSVALADAAALPEAACTVWSNVFDLAGLDTLDTLLVHGGGSGIGTLTIQLAHARGARVLTTARAAKHAALRDLGAEVTIDYTTDDFVAAVHRATADRGADVILDIMGGPYLSRNVSALATGGRLVVIGLQGGRTGDLNVGDLLARQGTIIATALRPRPTAEKAAIVSGVRSHVWPLIEAGLVRPIISATVPMPEAARAHEIVEASDHIGKVLLINPY